MWKSFVEKYRCATTGLIFCLIWEGTCFSLAMGCLGLQPSSAAGLKVSSYTFQKSLSQSHYRMKINVNLLGHWFLISRSTLFTQLVYGSIKWLWQYIAVTDNVQLPAGNSLALSSASLISLLDGWMACFSERALPRFTASRISHACMGSTAAPRQAQA